MQQKSKSKGSLVFAIVAVFAVGSTIASAGIGDRARAQLDDTRAALLVGARPQPVVSAFPELKLGTRDLEAARTGSRDEAVSALVRVLERADRIDNAQTLVSSLLAAKLIDGAVARVDAEPALLDDPRLAGALRRTSFASARHPLEGERRQAIARLSAVPSLVPVRTGGIAESTTAQAMEDVNATLHAMEDSAVAGNTTECEKSSQAAKGMAKHFVVGSSICKLAGGVVDTSHRLRALQARAALHAKRSPTKTARLPVTL